MKYLFWAIGLVIGLATSSGAYEKGELLYSCQLKHLVKAGNKECFYSKNEGKNHSGALVFENRNAKYNLLFHELPVEKLKGNIIFEVTLKLTDVKKSKLFISGASYCLVMEKANARKIWKGPYGNPETLKVGSSEWLTPNVVIFIPDDIRKCSLQLGLENATGKVIFDSVQIYRAVKNKSNQTQKYIQADTRLIPRGSGNGANFRGFNLGFGSFLRDTDYAKLKKYNVNLVRLFIEPSREEEKMIKEHKITYFEWLDKKVIQVEKMLDSCNENKMKLVATMSKIPAPGSEAMNIRQFASHSLGTNVNETSAILAKIWTVIAKKLNGHPALYGYDLLNEPDFPLEMFHKDRSAWKKMCIASVNAIRAIDKKTPIIIEPDLFEVRKVPIIDDPNIIYSFHTYAPIVYTHQQIGSHGIKYSYPGVINCAYWDKERLREDMKEIILLQKKQKAKIYIGEFSAAMWAEGREKYLNDCIELFEEYGWDWTYHSYGEKWPGWNIECIGTSLQDFKKLPDNPAAKVLLNGFGRNKPL